MSLVITVVSVIISSVESLIKPILVDEICLSHGLISQPTLDDVISTWINLNGLRIVLSQLSTGSSLSTTNRCRCGQSLSILSLFGFFTLEHHNLILRFVVESLVQTSYCHHLL